jgi:NitT/TauT family transport system permease protein
MSGRFDKFCLFAALAGFGVVLTSIMGPTAQISLFNTPLYGLCLALMIGVSLWFTWKQAATPVDGLGLLAVVIVGVFVALKVLYSYGMAGQADVSFWLFVLSLWAMIWRGIDCIASFKSLNSTWQRSVDIMIPVLFGAWLMFLWEVLVAGFDIPHVLLPPPSSIAVRFASSLDILRDDFYQTFMKAVLSGYIMGCGAGFMVAVLVDRVPFLQRGLLPLGNLVSALPIVGVAPIMVMWFGFDWQSKAAVVVIMTFFPMLVNTVTGLSEAGALEKDLMRSYGAGYWQNLFKLRLPASLPFIFNALKINSTLAMIGAIVAEFFGTPIVGMGFRISTEVGRMNVDMVWAEIVVAAIAGSTFYGVMALLERKFTFWHASYRHQH